VLHTCKLSTRETDAGRPRVQGQAAPILRLCLLNKEKKKEVRREIQNMSGAEIHWEFRGCRVERTYSLVGKQPTHWYPMS
jgi:hypothetical protein